MITSFDDIAGLLRSDTISVVRQYYGVDLNGQYYDHNREPLKDTVLQMDGEQHATMRRLLSAALSQRMKLLHSKAAIILRLITQNLGDKTSFDLIADFVDPFTDWLTAEMLGLDEGCVIQLRRWTEAYVIHGFHLGPGFVSAKVLGALEALQKVLIRNVRIQIEKNDGIAADLVRGGLSIDQVVNTFTLLATASMQTTKQAITNVIVMLLSDEHARCFAVANEDAAWRAVEECLRLDGPSQAVGRTATEDITLSGCLIPRGAFLRLALASANRDYSDANRDRIDILRKARRHLAFGLGPHSCLGAAIARSSIRAAVRALFGQFPNLSEIAGGSVRMHYSSLRGFSRFAVSSNW